MTSRGGEIVFLLSPVYSRCIVSICKSHDTVSKFTYVSIFANASKCVHANGALDTNCVAKRGLNAALQRQFDYAYCSHKLSAYANYQVGIWRRCQEWEPYLPYPLDHGLVMDASGKLSVDNCLEDIKQMHTAVHIS